MTSSVVQNFTLHRDDNKSLIYFSLEIERRPRLSPIISDPEFLPSCKYFKKILYAACVTIRQYSWSCVIFRDAKSREPGNLVPEHFWNKIRTFFRNQRLKEINLIFCCSFVKNRFKWMPVSIQIYLRHHDIYYYNPLFSKFVQINCPDISKSQNPGTKIIFLRVSSLYQF